jgi:signal transduction histidine kinase/CheY-like chemotaxis protein
VRTDSPRTIGAVVGRAGEVAGKLITERPFRVLGLVALAATAALTIQVSKAERELMERAALANAAQYANALDRTRAIYGAEVARPLEQRGYRFSDDYTAQADKDRPADARLPSPEALALMLGQAVSSQNAGGHVRIYSPYRPGGTPPDEFLRTAWERISAEPTLPYFRYVTLGGRPSVRYARALFAQDECHWCSQLGLSNGDVSGVLEVTRPLDSAIVMARSAAWHTFALTLTVTTLGLALVAFLVARLRRKSEASAALAEERREANERLRSEIAQRAEAEQALARANDRLTANHSTLERWAAELEIAHVRLREVDELKTKFLSEVSHELRSPMAAIVSAAKIIRKHHHSKPEVVERFGGTIVSEGARMTRLINDFLDLTKVESGCVEWNDADLELTDLVADVASGLDSLAIDSGIELVQRVEPGLPLLHADRDRLFQVLTNLTGNALKFTPGGGTVTIAAAAADGEIVLSVEDTGAGIAAEELPKVFDRFHQVKNIKADGARKGTGLGLCISREIVEHYGGRIWVESEPGSGSAFRFAVPADAALTGTVVNGVERRSAAPDGCQNARVLVMLDRPELAADAVSVPASQGIECRACVDLVELEGITASWKPDVLVVSSSLVEESGHNVVRRAHELGIAHMLIHSHEHGLTSPAVLDSAELLVPSLRALVPEGARVLVTEDDDRYRGILEFELKQAGFRVDTVGSGRAAIESIAADAPDAMILDLVMPDIDGLMVLEHFSGGKLEFPVLVYTAMDDPSVALAAKELGATEVFRKDTSGQVAYAAVAARVRRVLTSALTRGPRPAGLPRCDA